MNHSPGSGPGSLQSGRLPRDRPLWRRPCPARIEFDAQRFSAEALFGLADFSHVEVIYVFDRVAVDEIVLTARHPRGRKDWPRVGIFAQRGKGRPNRLGATICAIERVDALVLHVRGLDAIDGTPVIDLKPYMAEFAPRSPVHQTDWSHELMREYWEITPRPRASGRARMAS
jgi:tRNA-Thr(GGU) m(6)t(6)A37 methyltransferase TsaA